MVLRSGNIADQSRTMVLKPGRPTGSSGSVCRCQVHVDYKKALCVMFISLGSDVNMFVCHSFTCFFFSWVFLWEKAYQVRDTAIESSVMTKVKGFGNYSNRVMDGADYVTPTQV